MPPTRNFLISSLARIGSSFSRLRTWVIVLPIVFGLVFWLFGSFLRTTAEHYQRESLVNWQITELEAMGFEVEIDTARSNYLFIPGLGGNRYRLIKMIRLQGTKYPKSDDLVQVLQSLDFGFTLIVEDSNFNSRDLQNLTATNVWQLNAAGTAVDDCSAEGWRFPQLFRLDLRETKAGAKLVNSLGNSPRLGGVYIDPIPPEQLLQEDLYPFHIFRSMNRDKDPFRY